MTAAAKLTPARRNALEVLYRHGQARESNSTTHADNHSRPCIYWQSRAWLSKNGLIRQLPCGEYCLTDAGQKLAVTVLYPDHPARRGRPAREHVTVEGAPKVAYDSEAAATAAIAKLVAVDPDAELDAYRCQDCSRFHVGNAGVRHTAKVGRAG